MGNQKNIPTNKFSHPEITAKGEKRAKVEPTKLTTLWINSGTLCNLSCENCYIESSPKNDRLEYISLSEVNEYLDEILSENMGTTEIGFTGGEPFMNPEMISILEVTLKKGFKSLVLTNAMKPMQKRKEELLKLKKQFGDNLLMRVSLDHYSKELHEQERGLKAWEPAIQGLQWLSENKFNIDLAGRTLWNESDEQIRTGFANLFSAKNIQINSTDQKQLILFPEIDEAIEVPEITEACWGILNKKPEDIMCASSRMVVKRKGKDHPEVIACTLLPYDQRFSMGKSLKESWRAISLNHAHCAKFCVIGGGSCS